MNFYNQIINNIKQVIKGNETTVKYIIAAIIAKKHILLEDFPGTGKTTLAKAISKSLNLDFNRIQFTPDLLPSDIMGVSIYNAQKNIFEFHKGAIFTTILLADEINRAAPRTQSALLEAMAENQVTIDGEKHILNDNFFVIATQNPLEMSGTYPLPEAQTDRFSMKLSLGYLTQLQEISLLSEKEKNSNKLNELTPCLSVNDLNSAREEAKKIFISPELKKYIVNIVQSTRKHKDILIGASPRASIDLMDLSKVLAYFDGLDFVKPEYIYELSPFVISHRIKLNSQIKYSGVNESQIVKELLKKIPVPN